MIPLCYSPWYKDGPWKFSYMNSGHETFFSPPNLLRRFWFSLQPTLADTLWPVSNSYFSWKPLWTMYILTCNNKLTFKFFKLWIVFSQISLTWEYAPIVYENFKPPGLPTLDNKINTISMEVQLLLRRIVAVVPQKDVEGSFGFITFHFLLSLIVLAINWFTGLISLSAWPYKNLKPLHRMSKLPERQERDFSLYVFQFFSKVVSKLISLFLVIVFDTLQAFIDGVVDFPVISEELIESKR